MKKQESKNYGTTFFALALIASLFFELYFIMTDPYNYFMLIGIGIIILITGYLTFDSIEKSRRDLAARTAEQNEMMVKASKAIYLATKRSTKEAEQQHVQSIKAIELLMNNLIKNENDMVKHMISKNEEIAAKQIEQKNPEASDMSSLIDQLSESNAKLAKEVQSAITVNELVKANADLVRNVREVLSSSSVNQNNMAADISSYVSAAIAPMQAATQAAMLQQPMMQQPMMQQPMMQQPMMQQPMMQQPMMQQPMMQQPTIQQPSMQQSMMDIPSMDEPSMQQPTMDIPSMDKPSMEQPMMDIPSMDEPSMEQPMMDIPSIDEPSIEQPMMDIPSMDEPSIAQPTMDIPSMEQPTMDIPSMDEPSMEQVDLDAAFAKMEDLLNIPDATDIEQVDEISQPDLENEIQDKFNFETFEIDDAEENLSDESVSNDIINDVNTSELEEMVELEGATEAEEMPAELDKVMSASDDNPNRQLTEEEIAALFANL